MLKDLQAAVQDNTKPMKKCPKIFSTEPINIYTKKKTKPMNKYDYLKK